MEKVMHILFLADGLHPFTIGGMQKHSADMVRGFILHDVRVTLIFSIKHDQQKPDFKSIISALNLPSGYERYLTVHIVNFPENGFWPGHYLRESYVFSKTVFEVIQQNDISADFVYAQGFSAWYLLEQKSKGLVFAPVGVHFHGLNMFQKTFGWKASLSARMFQKSVRNNLKLADFVFSYGGKLKEVYAALEVERKTIFQPIGIDPSVISENINRTESRIKFIFIGRNDKIKGLSVLNECIRNLTVTDVEFYFIGDIPESMKLNQNNCRYYGVVNDMDKNNIIKGCDVLLCPSFSEGMPYVVLEAMSKGLVVVASHVGAIEEMLDASNGWLVEPGDPMALTDAITSVKNKSMMELDEMKLNSLRKSKEFEWNRILTDTINDIKTAIKFQNQ